MEWKSQTIFSYTVYLTQETTAVQQFILNA